jgi:hypothetical protein
MLVGDTIILARNGLGDILGNFFTNSSGHPGDGEPRANKRLQWPHLLNMLLVYTLQALKMSEDLFEGKWRSADQNSAFFPDEQRCQIFRDTIYQNGRKYTKSALNYQMAIKFTKW